MRNKRILLGVYSRIVPKIRQVFETIGRAEDWLKNNTWKNPLIKWETEIWGEIPADFGRK